MLLRAPVPEDLRRGPDLPLVTQVASRAKGASETVPHKQGLNHLLYVSFCKCGKGRPVMDRSWETKSRRLSMKEPGSPHVITDKASDRRAAPKTSARCPFALFKDCWLTLSTKKAGGWAG